MTDRHVEARALNALWRNHPDTAAKDRWGVRAQRMARANRDMLLSWAAAQPDYRLRDCRNIGTATLAWIRANQDRAAFKRAELHRSHYCDTCIGGAYTEGYNAGLAEMAERHSVVVGSEHGHVGAWCEACVAHGRDDGLSNEWQERPA